MEVSSDPGFDSGLCEPCRNLGGGEGGVTVGGRAGKARKEEMVQDQKGGGKITGDSNNLKGPGFHGVKLSWM